MSTFWPDRLLKFLGGAMERKCNLCKATTARSATNKHSGVDRNNICINALHKRLKL